MNENEMMVCTKIADLYKMKDDDGRIRYRTLRAICDTPIIENAWKPFPNVCFVFPQLISELILDETFSRAVTVLENILSNIYNAESEKDLLDKADYLFNRFNGMCDYYDDTDTLIKLFALSSTYFLTEREMKFYIKDFAEEYKFAKCSNKAKYKEIVEFMFSSLSEDTDIEWRLDGNLYYVPLLTIQMACANSNIIKIFEKDGGFEHFEDFLQNADITLNDFLEETIYEEYDVEKAVNEITEDILEKMFYAVNEDMLKICFKHNDNNVGEDVIDKLLDGFI